jgi:hypothetical protein
VLTFGSSLRIKLSLASIDEGAGAKTSSLRSAQYPFANCVEIFDHNRGGTKDVDSGGRMKRAREQKKIEHLYKAIATMRSEQGHNSVKERVQRVVEILKCDYGVSVPDNLHGMIVRRIREFNAAQSKS